jgi:hypothetical protein
MGGALAGIETRRKVYRDLVGKPKGKSILTRPKYRWKDRKNGR